MKFQYLAVIFVIIILPISLVLSFYTQAQIDIINTQSKYTSKLNDATYDAVKAFQLNTTNSYYSSVSDSKIRDIEASVNAFYNSLKASFNYTKEELQEFIPAMVYTLYDGYYIYGKRYNVYEVDRDDINDYGELQSMSIDTGLNDPNKYEYGLKPFVYYSCRYKKGNSDFVVNFTLDNFISIYGTVNGEYVNKSGYLINIYDCGGVTRNNSEKIGSQVTNIKTYKKVEISQAETLKEYLRFESEDHETGYVNNSKTTYEFSSSDDAEYEYVVYQNQKIYVKREDFDIDLNPNYNKNDIYFWCDQRGVHTIESQEIKDAVNKGTTSARQYYIDALNFSEWVNYYLEDIGQSNIRTVITNEDGTTEIKDGGDNLEYNAGDSEIFDMTTQDPEDVASTFNQHRIAVIKNSIETNLMAAINSYNNSSNSFEYAMPKLSEEDWEKVVNNVCVVSFMQGFPMGGKYFNGYVVIPNDKNNEFVDIDSVYILTSDGQYHLPNCPDLVENKNSLQSKITGGYINTSFERQAVEISNTTYYYYKHPYRILNNKPQYYTACYSCAVNENGKYDLENDIFMNKSNKIGSYDITTLRSRYLTILAREKYNLYKTNN